ncbi:MAG: DUF2066 domain-containing protein [Alphaproteobacteria bacterium]|nr:DUF2066 domain-containing protein [Alphaproteobacteria bacterium]
MAIFYKHFDKARIVFWALFICFLFIATNVKAQNALFTVDGIDVDVTANSALTARDTAFIEAQKKAFDVLAQRMLSENELRKFELPEIFVISALIKDYEVTKEKFSSVRYMGTYGFRFKDKAVRRYFSGRGVQYTDVSSRPVLILPYYQFGEHVVLWSPYNSWMQAWNRYNDLGGLVPVVVPLGDIQDVRDIGDEQSLTYDEMRLHSMLGRYDTGEAVIVVAVPDKNLSLVYKDSDPASGALTVYIYRTDRAHLEYVTQIIETARSGQTKADLLNKAVKRVYKTLQKDWKKKTVVSASQSNKLIANISFKTLSQWVKTREVLEIVHGINEISIKSISPKRAQIEIMFQGTEDRLRLALQQSNVTLSEPRFAMTTGLVNNMQGGSSLVYELYLNRYAPSETRFTIGGG